MSFACAVVLVAAWCAPPSRRRERPARRGRGRRLVTLNPDGSGLRTLPGPDAGQITELAFSPGGNRLAFVKAGELGRCSSSRPGGS